MTTTFKRVMIGAAALAAAGAVSTVANAGCGDNMVKEPADWLSMPNDPANPLLTKVSLGDAPITGMWGVKFFAGSNMIDFGYQVWHGDGTEFMNSGGRAPATQNYCLGVWAQTGQYTYKLNHWALSYDATGHLNAKVNIKETVTLDVHADYYSGPFTIDAYNPTNGALLQHVAGQVTGNRIRVN